MTEQKLVTVSESRIEALKSELGQQLEQKQKTKGKGKKEFAGNITRLKYVSEALAVDAEVRFAPVDSKVLEESRTIIHEAHLPDGKAIDVRLCKTPKQRTVWLDTATESTEYPENLVHHYEVIKDTNEKNEIGDHLTRNVTLEVCKTIPLTEVEEWLVEDDYEVWSETSVESCWRLAEEWRKKDLAGVVKGFCHGRPKSYKESSALLYPILNEKGEFVFRMSLARIRKKRAFKHWMPQNGKDEPKEPIAIARKKPKSVVEEI
jgi:hypothetical protein